MNQFLLELRYALRRLRKSPGSTAAAMLTLALNMGATFAAGKRLEHTLYPTSGFQPLVILAVIALMLLSAAAAAGIPARRAASIEPNTALRSE